MKKMAEESSLIDIGRQKYYRYLRKKSLLRLFLTYVLPLIIVIIYFQLQYSTLIKDDQALRLKSVAVSISKTLDLFLWERSGNLINLLDDPKIITTPSDSTLQSFLSRLRKDSEAFIDIGYFDSTGLQKEYAGPYQDLTLKDCSHQSWFISLKNSDSRYFISDVYLKFQQQPHFTIGAKRIINNQLYILKVSLDPKNIYEIITTIEHSGDVKISIVNEKGLYQLLTSSNGKISDDSPILPPKDQKIGIEQTKINNNSIIFSYAWLNEAKWAVIVQNKNRSKDESFLTETNRVLFISAVIIFLLMAVIIYRSKKIVIEIEKKDTAVEEKNIVKLQLEHASRLASVGELASGVAHELNNPLAIIASEVNTIKEIINPSLQSNPECSELELHVGNIYNACFKCRDITKKLLSFVQQNDFKISENRLEKIIDDIIDEFYIHKLSVSEIELIKLYDNDLPALITDAYQVRQVILTIINNAIDAITPPGKITIKLRRMGNAVSISITDTGRGISPNELEKIFLPFYTTKKAGKGTGLGLAVSYDIIQNLGGRIEVESTVGQGSTFTVFLPIEPLHLTKFNL